MKGHAFSELLLLPGRFNATVKRCAKEQEKLGEYTASQSFWGEKKTLSLFGMKLCEQTENAPAA